MRSVDDLLGDADVAMYQAKALGKGRHHVFDRRTRPARAARERTWSDAAEPSGDRRSARPASNRAPARSGVGG